VTQRAWITGGINAPVAVFYVLFIIMAGVLIGTRGSLVTAAVCLLGAIILTIGTARVWLTPRPGAGSPLGGFVFVVLAISLALVIQVLLAFRPRREGLGVNAVQMLVHDMRTPMQVLLAHLELLRYNINGEAAQDVEAAIDGATTLSRMTTSLLDVSRLEAGRMPVQRVRTDLFTLAHSVVKTIRILQPTFDIAVEASGDSVWQCDPELTRRIIENLVSNSMKHTTTEGRVRVLISGSQHLARIAVHDNGPGIPRAKRNGIFDLYSAEGLLSTTGTESSGIGLAFCRLAAEAQGGTIRIEDDAADGSVFVVELPQ
jgi:signal transduction histidine kinase